MSKPNVMFELEEFGNDTGGKESITQSFFEGTLEKVTLKTPTFNEPEYLHDRQKITTILRRLHRRTKTEVGDTLICLEAFWNKPIDLIVQDLVADFNNRGIDFCRYKYRFGKNHTFDWLPKTDKQIPIGLVYCKAVGGFVRWQAGLPKEWREMRVERGLPDITTLISTQSISQAQLKREAKMTTPRKQKKISM